MNLLNLQMELAEKQEAYFRSAKSIVRKTRESEKELQKLKEVVLRY